MICGNEAGRLRAHPARPAQVIPVEAVYDQFMAEKQTAAIVTGEDRELKNCMWKPSAKGKIALNPDIIAKSAQINIVGAGISIPEGTDTNILTHDQVVFPTTVTIPPAFLAID